MNSGVAADYKLPLKRAAVDVKRLDEGTLVARALYVAPEPASRPNVWLRKWASETPDEIFIAQPDAAANSRGTLTYADGSGGGRGHRHQVRQMGPWSG